jgi:nicotinamidase-related amidase
LTPAQSTASTVPALVLVDIQQDYFPAGALPLVAPDAALAAARTVLAAFRARRWPIVHVQHRSTRPGATFLLPDTPGAAFHPGVAPEPGEPVVVKHFPNAFRETPLDDLLRQSGAGRLVLVGMMTHMCIDATARAAFDLGWPVTVVADATATRPLAFGGQTVPADHVQAAFLAALDGVFARVVKAADWLKELSPS